MEIPLFISELLDDQDYVVVPGLGGFLCSYKPAVVSEDKSVVFPPSRTVAFYPEMKSNDGVLAGFIAQHQKIPLPQASRILEKYTGDLLMRLENGEKAELGKLGVLSMESGDIQFIPGEVSRESPHSYGLSPVTIEERTAVPGQPETIRKEGKRKRIPLWARVSIILVLMVSALSVYLVFSPENNDNDSSGPVPVSDSARFTESGTPGAADTTETMPPGEINSEILPDSTGTQILHPRKELFYTIGGSFRSQENAAEYYRKMTDKGFHPLQLGLINNFYLVALDTFFTANEAFEAADRYSAVTGTTKIWVYHPK